MPPSRQARARQQRQRERLAVQAARRAEKRKRRQRIGVTAGALVLIIALVLAFTVGMSSNTTTKKSTNPNDCVGLKDTPPAAAPSMPNLAVPRPTKLITQDLKTGSGAVVKPGAKVQMNYIVVACSTGKIVDASYGKQPYDADLSASGGLIAGWQQGIPGMKVGGRRFLEIPSDLAYGASGRAPIGPNEPLFFVVDALKIEG